jgi:hypothetical protein
VDVRHQTADGIKEEVPTRDDVFAHIAPLAERASVQTAGLALCDQQMKKLAFETRRVALASRSIFNLNPHPASPWVNPDDVDNDFAFFGVMAPWVKELCEGVWN